MEVAYISKASFDYLILILTDFYVILFALDKTFMLGLVSRSYRDDRSLSFSVGMIFKCSCNL